VEVPKVRSGFLFFALLFAAIPFSVQSWAQSSTITDSEMMEAAGSAEWLHLLHYRKKLFRGYESILHGQGYFLSDNGARDPLQELRASVEILFMKTPSLQCEYLARTDFILRRWPHFADTAVACRRFEDWKEKLGAQSVSLIFATSYLNSAGSSFGHTFLKLENPKNINRGELLDYGINFAARTKDTTGALYAWYGLLGYFPGSFAMLPYHHLIKEYTNLEGRDLWEYELNLSPQEVDRLLKYLLEMEKTYIDYYFLDDNCSYEILWALQAARPELRLVSDREAWMIPLDSVKIVERAGLITQKRFRSSLMRRWQTQLQNLTPLQRADLKSILSVVESKDDIDPEKLPDNVPVIEAAQAYAAIRYYEEFEKGKKRNYLLARKRAQLPLAEEVKIPVPEVSPDMTHDSALLELGSGRNLDQRYQSLHLHPAFHSWLSDDRGVSPSSELEVLDLEFRQYQGYSRLEEAHLLRILSSQAINEFFRPISWGFEISYEHYLIDSGLERPLIKGRAGYSVDPLKTLRFSAFLTAGGQKNIDTEYSGVYGLEFRARLMIKPSLRLGIQYQIDRDGWQRTLEEILVEGVADITHQVEIKTYGHQQQFQGNSGQDIGLALSYHFIFSAF
jgi:hypothetical protein